MLGPDNPRTLYLVDRITEALETATDCYARSGQALRAYLMEEVLREPQITFSSIADLPNSF